MDRFIPLLATLVAGGAVALQPPANASLARHVGDFGAAFVSLLLSTLIVAVIVVLIGQTSDLGGIATIRPEHLIGGFAGAAIVVVTLIAVRPLGATGVVAGVVAGQLVVAALADRLGVLGLDRTPLTPLRIAGMLLLVGGTVLVIR